MFHFHRIDRFVFTSWQWISLRWNRKRLVAHSESKQINFVQIFDG